MHEAPVNVPSRFIDFIDVLPISDAASAAAPSAPMRFSAPEKSRMRSTQEYIVPRVVATKSYTIQSATKQEQPTHATWTRTHAHACFTPHMQNSTAQKQ